VGDTAECCRGSDPTVDSSAGAADPVSVSASGSVLSGMRGAHEILPI
jgi:hypothetical protein